MRKFRNQSGIVAIELVLLVVILVVIGFVGYKVMGASKNVDKADNNIDAVQNVKQAKLSTATEEPKAPTISSSKDLDSAAKSVDQVNPDDNNADSAQLDTQLAAF